MTPEQPIIIPTPEKQHPDVLEPLVRKDNPQQPHKWLQMKKGDYLLVHGFICEIVHINEGARRFSLTPVNPKVPMPCTKLSTNPIVRARTKMTVKGKPAEASR